MTLCAGICYSRRQGSGWQCTIRLSRPLLRFRPFSDTINTLLHEMIHAFTFIKFGGTLQRDGHGPDFQAIMNRINQHAGTSITIYHTFHAEVKACRTHVWRCQGPCQNRSPFFGWCRRSMNRPPQPADTWWADHQRSCGGYFVKISSPETGKERKSGQDKKKKDISTPSISGYFKQLGKGQKLGGDDKPAPMITKSPANNITIIDLTDS